jgi:hypothetical protein
MPRRLAASPERKTGRRPVAGESGRRSSNRFGVPRGDVCTAEEIQEILEKGTRQRLEELRKNVLEEGSISLHFLPPCYPQHNRIERLWEDLHAQVIRNHTCRTTGHLMQRVRALLRRRSKNASNASARRTARRAA